MSFYKRNRERLVVSQAARVFAERHPDACLVSIHDCLLSTSEHVAELRELLEDAYHDFCVRPKMNGIDYTPVLEGEFETEDQAA